MEQAVEKHARVSVGEDETIAVRPARVFRIVAEKLLPKAIADGGQGHRSARMTTVRFLNCIDRKSPDRVDAYIVHVASLQWA